MTLKEAIQICKEMQKWRRSEPPYDGETSETYKEMPYSSKVFGEAMDKLIRFTESSMQCSDVFSIMFNIKESNK